MDFDFYMAGRTCPSTPNRPPNASTRHRNRTEPTYRDIRSSAEGQPSEATLTGGQRMDGRGRRVVDLQLAMGAFLQRGDGYPPPGTRAGRRATRVTRGKFRGFVKAKVSPPAGHRRSFYPSAPGDDQEGGLSSRGRRYAVQTTGLGRQPHPPASSRKEGPPRPSAGERS